MNILLLSPLFNYGGAEKQYRKLVDIVEKEVNEVSVLSIDGAATRGIGVVYSGLFKLLSVDVKKNKMTRYFKLPLFYLAILSLIISGKYRVVYSYSLYCLPALLLVALYNKLFAKNIEIIYSERIYNEFVKKSLKHNFLYSLLDTVVVNSDELKHEFVSSGVKNVVLVSNFVTPIAFNNGTHELLEPKPDIHKGKKNIRIGIPARINKEKNQCFIISELASCEYMVADSFITINLYGEVDDSAYFNEIMKLNTKGNIHHFTNKPLSEIYNENELICLPSLYEGTSNVILEAMINKKYFLCSNIKANTVIPVDVDNLFPLSNGGFVKTLSSFLSQSENSKILQLESNYSQCFKSYGIGSYKKNIMELFGLIKDEDKL